MEINWNKIIGHEENIAQLKLLVQEDRLPHALLFCGPYGIGKFLTAQVLAASLLCANKQSACGTCPSCQALLAGTHPDFYVIEPEGKTIKMIKIEQIRRLQAEISRAPYLSDKRVVIIDQADKMNEAAANSLLKTLEEPTGQVVFILVAASRDALLDTIISRSMPIPFQPLRRETLAAALVERGIDSADSLVLAGLAEGSFGRALDLSDNDGLARRDAALDFLTNLSTFSLEEIWAESQKLGDYTREELQETISYLNMLLRDLLVLSDEAGQEPLYNSDRAEELKRQLSDWDMPKIFSALAASNMVQQRLRSNANTRLLMEQFLLKIRDLK